MRGLEGLGVDVVGEVEQVCVGPGEEVGVEVVGQGGESAEDGLGLLEVDPSCGERGPGQVVGC